MASIDEMRFEMRDGRFPSGGAFTLQAPSTVGEATYFDNWRVEISEGSQVVMATGGGASTYDESLGSSLQKAYEGLDALSVQGLVDLDLKAPLDAHVVWWCDKGGTTHAALVEEVELRMQVGRITLVATEASGQALLPTPPPTLAPHPSFRFFRRAQVTDDLFDAYRNAFLALEAILSDIVPRLRGADGGLEGEQKWLLRALREVHNSGLVDLNKLLPTASANPAQRLVKQLWTQVRTALFHAKKNAPILSPANADDRDQVLGALMTLRQLFLALVEAHLGLRRSSSGVYAGFITPNMQSTFEQAECYATDDPTPIEPDRSVPNPAGGRLAKMSITQVDRIEPWVVELRAHVDAPAMDALTCLASIVLTSNEEQPLLAIAPDGQLLLDGIDVFETRIRNRATNHAQLKERFAS